MASRSGGWRIVRGDAGGVREESARVLDAEETGSAVAETLAALTAAQALRAAPSLEGGPAEAVAAATDTVRYPAEAAAEPRGALRKFAKSELAAAKEEDEEEEAEAAEDVPKSAAEILADERAAALHPPPEADTPEARPKDRVPPVRAPAAARAGTHAESLGASQGFSLRRARRFPLAPRAGGADERRGEGGAARAGGRAQGGHWRSALTHARHTQSSAHARIPFPRCALCLPLRPR
jgi:hypothetical protein